MDFIILYHFRGMQLRVTLACYRLWLWRSDSNISYKI